MWTIWISVTTRMSPQLSYLQLWLSQVPCKTAHPLLPFMSSCQWKIIPPWSSENSQGGHRAKALTKVTVRWPRGSHGYSQVRSSTNARQYQAHHSQGLWNSKCPSWTHLFCAGDVKQHEHRRSCPARATARGNTLTTAHTWQYFISDFNKVFTSMWSSNKPVCSTLFPENTSCSKKDKNFCCSCYLLTILSQVSLWCFVSITRFPEVSTEVQRHSEENRELVDYLSLHLNYIQLANVI